jgi:hypothetical protein
MLSAHDNVASRARTACICSVLIVFSLIYIGLLT